MLSLSLSSDAFIGVYSGQTFDGHITSYYSQKFTIGSPYLWLPEDGYRDSICFAIRSCRYGHLGRLRGVQRLRRANKVLWNRPMTDLGCNKFLKSCFVGWSCVFNPKFQWVHCFSSYGVKGGQNINPWTRCYFICRETFFPHVHNPVLSHFL